MQIGRIAGATRVIGKSQGYLGLPVRDERADCPVNGPDTHSMVTSWQPTPEEISAIAAGAPVHVRLLMFGMPHPPIMVEVGEIPGKEGMSSS